MMNSANLSLNRTLIKDNQTSLFVVKGMVFLTVLLPLTSSLNTILPFSLNRIIALAIFFLIIVHLFAVRKLTVLSVFLIAYLALVFVHSSLYSLDHFSENVEDFIYFSMTCLVFLCLGDVPFCNNLIIELRKRKFFLKAMVFLTFVVNVIAIMVKNGSYEPDGSFKGFAVISHAIATLFVLAMVLMLISKEKNILWYLPCLYFVFISRARTFLVPCAIILLLYVLYNFHKLSTRMIIISIAIIAVVVVFPQTSMYAKFVSSSSNPWSGITNSRITFWTEDLNNYIHEYSFLEKLFGKGFSWVRTINQRVTGGRIWAHNDFINVLLSTGAFGVVFYFTLFFASLKKLKNWFYRIVMIIYVVFPALINGLYDYFPLVLSILFLMHSSGEFLLKKDKLKNA